MNYKLIILILVLLSQISTACQKNKNFKLRFCSDISYSEPCIGEDTIFYGASNIWVQLFLDPDFKGDKVSGKLYRFENGTRNFIESKEMAIKPGQAVLMEMMVIVMDGRFEVEFVDQQGFFLIKKGFEIW